MADTSFEKFLRDWFGSAFSYVRGFSLTTGHRGIDLSAAKGTPIQAVSGGEVIFAASTGKGAPNFTIGGGNVVVVKTASGLYENYAHLDSFGVHKGDIITKGTIIGKVGETGNATGPHLHFAIWDPIAGKFIDPVPYLRSLENTGQALGAWNNVVSFPEGHILSGADVNAIITKLDNAHFFQATNIIPGLQQLSEIQARDKTRAILMSHVGEEWNKALQDKLQKELFGAAAAAVDNPLNNFANILTDPITYFKVGAIALALVLIVKGATTIVSKSGA